MKGKGTYNVPWALMLALALILVACGRTAEAPAATEAPAAPEEEAMEEAAPVEELAL